ncbi:hypothetical protein [Thalassospira xiamenensis]|uniref:hypothetical protein n=1 Tax=Thalassospira xiamenensis TaxID=220697 RepID=UPI000DEE16D5|nr:hypothetical protein [Thalassospira xiamenensis]RCK40499.1 hypothetical protein TH24_11290 [Thalassospira xiamenensis]
MKLLRDLMRDPVIWVFAVAGAVIGGVGAFFLIGGVWLTIAGVAGGAVTGVIVFMILLMIALASGG